jgi:hypothetical protein
MSWLRGSTMRALEGNECSPPLICITPSGPVRTKSGTQADDHHHVPLKKTPFFFKTLKYSEPVTLTFVYVTAFGVVFMHVFGLFFSLSGTGATTLLVP